MKDYWLGLDVGGTKCCVLLAKVDHGIHFVDKIRFDTKSERGFEYAYNLLCESMEEILERNGTDFSNVNAIGVSCGGPLDSRSGVVLCPPNLPGWINIPLVQLLTDRFGTADGFMTVADFKDYARAQKAVGETYPDRHAFTSMSLVNIAKAGIFSADRAVREYADRIWKM